MLKKLMYIILAYIATFVPAVSSAQCFTDKHYERQINDIAFVVYCEDRSDDTAVRLVMSTIYNRAQSYDVQLLHNEIAKKNQYYCYNMKSSTRKIDSQRFSDVKEIVCDFIINERSPITIARYFYSHKLIRPKFATRLTKILVYGSHTYLV